MCQYCFNRNKKLATNDTIQWNRKAASDLGLDWRHCSNGEFELSKEKCIFPLKDFVVPSQMGHAAWDLRQFSFFENEEAPVSVNPSLWLNGKSNYQAGVYEVVKNAIYQVRGIDISNLTIIRSKNGWIVQDVMTTIETSKAAMELLEQALREPIISKVTAVIISHSHSDHYGGIKGVVAPEQVGAAAEGKIPVYVPAGFDEACVKESIFAGTAMGRRGNYQFGMDIEPGEQGIVSTGIGLTSSKGTISFITPTDYVRTDETVVIDGITVEFQLTPETEAPAEMNNYFADYKALWMAENCCGTLHNLYPIRGAQLRDSSRWSDYILEAMVKYADRSDVVFQSHSWPHFNTKEHPNAVGEYLLNCAAVYKYTHDQTLLYANQGYTAKEIARKIKLPEGLKHNWYTRPYYGALPMNARAVYTKYLGFFNGHPNDLDPLTEVEAAKIFVEYAGGEENVLKQAVKDFEAGSYRKVSYAAGNLVLANPKNEKARLLCADAFEQLGYIAESSIWRNAYLQGALELRYGVNAKRPKITRNQDITQCMTGNLLLKYIGILLDGEKAGKEEFRFALNLKENGENTTYTIHLYAGVLLAYPNPKASQDKYATLEKNDLFLLSQKKLLENKKQIDTNCHEYLERLQGYLVDLKETADFNLIEP